MMFTIQYYKTQPVFSIQGLANEMIPTASGIVSATWSRLQYLECTATVASSEPTPLQDAW